ncbi:hypothetical protein H6P81_012104 [Aristolochia fimbriata]|uniref:Uncharacterized protein n=1 Tax=Aristolochia fimbriata TaxID=158543 RepID=A0AAV7EDN9_ARIFI|nr:hypothetical protein H6P81_012104 [Aristolochia fimbriata]
MCLRFKRRRPGSVINTRLFRDLEKTVSPGPDSNICPCFRSGRDGSAERKNGEQVSILFAGGCRERKESPLHR